MQNTYEVQLLRAALLGINSQEGNREGVYLQLAGAEGRLNIRRLWAR